MHLLCSFEEILLCKWKELDLGSLKNEAWFLELGFEAGGLSELPKRDTNNENLLMICLDRLARNVS